MIKRISLVPLLVSTLVISSISFSEAAVNAKAGGTCSKAGQISIVATKKFTCVKNGKKLVWNKGLAILPQPVFTANAAANNYEWEVTVTNYLGRIDPALEFSYSFAVNGGMWNLFLNRNYQKKRLSSISHLIYLRLKSQWKIQTINMSLHHHFSDNFELP